MTQEKSMVPYYGFNERAIKENIRHDILQDPQGFIEDRFKSRFTFGMDNIMSFGVYRQMAWEYDLRDYLKKYLYRQYGEWTEVYAPNKTSLRKVTSGHIDKIIELED